MAVVCLFYCTVQTMTNEVSKRLLMYCFVMIKIVDVVQTTKIERMVNVFDEKRKMCKFCTKNTNWSSV